MKSRRRKTGSDRSVLRKIRRPTSHGTSYRLDTILDIGEPAVHVFADNFGGLPEVLKFKKLRSVSDVELKQFIRVHAFSSIVFINAVIELLAFEKSHCSEHRILAQIESEPIVHFGDPTTTWPALTLFNFTNAVGAADKCDQPRTLVPFILKLANSSESHANLLVVDNKSKTVQHFEPNGDTPFGAYLAFMDELPESYVGPVRQWMMDENVYPREILESKRGMLLFVMKQHGVDNFQHEIIKIGYTTMLWQVRYQIHRRLQISSDIKYALVIDDRCDIQAKHTDLLKKDLPAVVAVQLVGNGLCAVWASIAAIVAVRQQSLTVNKAMDFISKWVQKRASTRIHLIISFVKMIMEAALPKSYREFERILHMLVERDGE